MAVNKRSNWYRNNIIKIGTSTVHSCSSQPGTRTSHEKSKTHFNITLTKQKRVVTHRHTVVHVSETTWQIINRSTLLGMLGFLWTYKKQQCFVDETFWQVCFQRNCLVMRESQFNKLCWLRQMAVSWVIHFFYTSDQPSNLLDNRRTHWTRSVDSMHT